ncbi:hypothetical protein LTR62_003697 [Meristemomyces frigidus]|uniref:Probable endonuclease LCL3 n=1 Tax=Meristemomyces frigidus TaxID=1508187 RepID=A0AAN7YKH5_9PEZI|nr:hypothetical protein LTR62_003697 [Meristemomyces frigidus]
MPWQDWIWSRWSRKSDNTTDTITRQAQTEPPTKKRSTWNAYLEPRTITACLATATATYAGARLYRTYLRRIRTAGYIKPTDFHKRSLYGYVTSVGDGDGFHLYHTPGGRLAGWGWYKGRKPQELDRKQLKEQTVSVRLAGIDAPECAHFGNPDQPFGPEALAWLRDAIQGRYVRMTVHKVDQYQRVVGTAYRRKWGFLKSDVGLEMLKCGLATVYEAKSGAEFGGKEEVYRRAEGRAKSRGVGMWRDVGLVGKLLGRKGGGLESPREYKSRIAARDKEVKVVGGKA